MQTSDRSSPFLQRAWPGRAAQKEISACKTRLKSEPCGFVCRGRGSASSAVRRIFQEAISREGLAQLLPFTTTETEFHTFRKNHLGSLREVFRRQAAETKAGKWDSIKLNEHSEEGRLRLGRTYFHIMCLRRS